MKYSVIMKTQLGDRYGTLELNESRPETQGVLYILENRNEVSGYVSLDGKCRFEGKLKTLMRSRPFVAEGSISAQSLTLLLYGHGETWAMTGIPIT